MKHPGQILREEYFINLNKSLEFIKCTGICPNVFSNLLQEKIDIDNSIANSLSFYFKNNPEYYINLQIDFNKNKRK